MEAKLKRAFLYEYHIQALSCLESDLESEEAGFSQHLNEDLFKRYGTTDWKVAYQNAAAWHQKELEGTTWSEVWNAVGGYSSHERAVDNWVWDNMRLGDDPKTMPDTTPTPERQKCVCPIQLILQAGCKCGGT